MKWNILTGKKNIDSFKHNCHTIRSQELKIWVYCEQGNRWNRYLWKWFFLFLFSYSYLIFKSQFACRVELAVKNSFQKILAIAFKECFTNIGLLKQVGVSNCCNFLNFVITRQTNDIDWCKFANFTKRFWQGHSAEPKCGRHFNILSENYEPFLI